MEPITILVCTLNYFFGYYIGTDLYNYHKNQSNYKNTRDALDSITRTLSRIETRIEELKSNEK